MENSMVVTTATAARRIGGVASSLTWLSPCVLSPDKPRAVTTELAPASASSNLNERRPS
jgi:hypothetical protein